MGEKLTQQLAVGDQGLNGLRLRLAFRPQRKLALSDSDEGDADAAMVRELYDSFEGLGDDSGDLNGEAAFEAVLTGPLSAYLTPAVVGAYFEQYGDARLGNSRKRRSR
ncbi:MAG TPA: hypothetical protein PKE36_00645 [Chiayiivirga sp.]|nr:hypothetical protein [Chiayiivirga sp.]